MATIAVYFKPTFVRQFKKLDPTLQGEVLEKIELFTNTHNHNTLAVHKLHGPLSGSSSFLVNFKYRIVFEYLSKNEAVLLAIGDHEVYR